MPPKELPVQVSILATGKNETTMMHIERLLVTKNIYEENSITDNLQKNAG